MKTLIVSLYSMLNYNVLYCISLCIAIQLTVRSQEGVWSVSAFLDSSMLLDSEEYKWRIIQRLFEILEKDSKKGEPTSAQHNSPK